MRFYFCHSRAIDYQKDLYAPLRASILNKQHEIIFPHELSDVPFNVRPVLKTLDIVFAEVSQPSTGMGIELGWASAAYLPIVCLHRAGTQPSGSLQVISKYFIEYTDSADLVKKLIDFIGRISFE